MSISSLLRPRCLAARLVAVALLVPTCNPRVERNAGLDIEMVRSAECEYRGITASFDEVSRAYSIQVYRQATPAGWESRPNPRHPEAEALVTGTFTITGLQDEAPAAWGRGPEVRARVGDRVALTWCLNTVAGVRVTPHDDYARDAVEVFRATVDGFLDRMVFLTEAAALRSEPSPDAEAVAQLEIGQVLLREASESDWVLARVPATRTLGWVPGAVVQAVGQ